MSSYKLDKGPFELEWEAEHDMDGAWYVLPVGQDIDLLSGLSEELAKHIVYLHNTWLEECG